MLPLIATTFLASLLGSLHCAGMCGAFVALAVMPMPGDERHPPTSRALVSAAYNAGRLITYTLLGGAAGFLGEAVNRVGESTGAGAFAAGLAGGLLVIFGGWRLLTALGVRMPSIRLPGAWVRLVSRAHGLAGRLHPMYRSLSIGMLSTLLPCGWLYAFAVTASGTGDPVRGALTMAAFWAGTLPVMMSLGAGVRTMAGPLGARLPAITSAAMIIVGCATLTGRVLVPDLQCTQRHAARGVICNEP